MTREEKIAFRQRIIDAIAKSWEITVAKKRKLGQKIVIMQDGVIKEVDP